jgi:polyphosphate kinase
LSACRANARYIAVETLVNGSRRSPLSRDSRSASSATFRVLRDSDIELEEEAEDLVLYFRTAIKRRRRGRVIRLEMEEGIDPGLEAVLNEELGGSEALLTETGGFLGNRGDLCADRRRGSPRPEIPALFAARFPSGSANMTAIVLRQSRPRTSLSTTPTNPSTSCSPSSNRPRATPM